MVTAILPAIVAQSKASTPASPRPVQRPNDVQTKPPSVVSEATVTPERSQGQSSSDKHVLQVSVQKSSSTRLAGFVGLFTGLGALLALTLFLPLPARLGERGLGAGDAVKDSYYLVGSVAQVIAVICFFGLRRLPIKSEARETDQEAPRTSEIKDMRQRTNPVKAFGKAIMYGITDSSLGLSYIGGFVARASSVAISLFIPLYVNTYFISRGDCKEVDGENGQIKEHCRGAYILASQLTGVSQLVALIFAPVFGYVSEHSTRFNIPLIIGALLGIIGYLGFAYTSTPDPKAAGGSGFIFVAVSFIGISQISAIVVSLGLLGQRVTLADPKGEQDILRLPLQLANGFRAGDTHDPTIDEGDGACAASLPSMPDDRNQINSEEQPLLSDGKHPEQSKFDSKGAIAGVYSFAGGAGILLLTKLGGYLFDVSSPKAPFIMLSVFNMILLLACLLRGATGSLEKS